MKRAILILALAALVPLLLAQTSLWPAGNVKVEHTPVNYTKEAEAELEGHLSGIDTALANAGGGAPGTGNGALHVSATAAGTPGVCTEFDANGNLVPAASGEACPSATNGCNADQLLLEILTEEDWGDLTMAHYGGWSAAGGAVAGGRFWQGSNRDGQHTRRTYDPNDWFYLAPVGIVSVDCDGAGVDLVKDDWCRQGTDMYLCTQDSCDAGAGMVLQPDVTVYATSEVLSDCTSTSLSNSRLCRDSDNDDIWTCTRTAACGISSGNHIQVNDPLDFCYRGPTQTAMLEMMFNPYTPGGDPVNAYTTAIYLKTEDTATDIRMASADAIESPLNFGGGDNWTGSVVWRQRFLLENGHCYAGLGGFAGTPCTSPDTGCTPRLEGFTLRVYTSD